MSYDLLRGLHILSVIAWMAGLLYLPRLFAYHTKAAAGLGDGRSPSRPWSASSTGSS